MYRFVFFFQVCAGFCFPSSPCISTVHVGRFHWPALCGWPELFLSVQCLQPGSTCDTWRVYPSPHGCFTSLSFLLNFQVITSPLLTSFKLAELLALPVRLLLRSLFKLTPLQIQRGHSGNEKTLLIFPVCPGWTIKQQSFRGWEQLQSFSWTNISQFVACFRSISGGLKWLFVTVLTKLYSCFLENWFIQLFTYSCWKLPSEQEIFTVSFPSLERWCTRKVRALGWKLFGLDSAS